MSRLDGLGMCGGVEVGGVGMAGAKLWAGRGGCMTAYSDLWYAPLCIPY